MPKALPHVTVDLNLRHRAIFDKREAAIINTSYRRQSSESLLDRENFQSSIRNHILEVRSFIWSLKVSAAEVRGLFGGINTESIPFYLVSQIDKMKALESSDNNHE